MRTAYLDQNKWIQLARVAHGRDADPDILAVIEFMDLARRQGHLRFPLSAAHYTETAKQHNRQRAARLAKFMISYSRLDTIALPGVVIHWELVRALNRRCPEKVELAPFELLGFGIRHAANFPWAFRIDDPDKVLPADLKEEWEQQAQMAFELSAFIGAADPEVAEHMRTGLAEYDQSFKHSLERLPSELDRFSPERQTRIIAGNCLRDMRPLVEEVLQQHGLDDLVPDWSPKDASDPSLPMWGEILQEMPSRRVEMHLQLQYARNPSLRKQDTDLRDHSYLGIAVAHCDIVVCEKQLANLVNRGDLVKKAQVITDLRELPRL